MKNIYIQPKYFFVIFIVIILAFSVFYYYKFYLKPIEIEEPEEFPVEEIFYPAKLTFSLDKKTFSVEETFLATVLVDTGSRKTVGVDAVLKYDPEFLEIVEENGKFVDYSESDFDIFPGGRFDPETGDVRFSALVGPEEAPLIGSGKIGTLKFKTLKEGETSLSFVHDLRFTGDSNVAWEGKDILGKIEDASIKIE